MFDSVTNSKCYLFLRKKYFSVIFISKNYFKNIFFTKNIFNVTIEVTFLTHSGEQAEAQPIYSLFGKLHLLLSYVTVQQLRTTTILPLKQRCRNFWQRSYCKKSIQHLTFFWLSTNLDYRI